MMTYYLKKETVQELLDSGKMFTSKVAPENRPSASDVIEWEMPDPIAMKYFRTGVLTAPRGHKPWSQDETSFLINSFMNGVGITTTALLLERNEEEIINAMLGPAEIEPAPATDTEESEN